MKLLIISDLHIPERAKAVPGKILDEAKISDVIICAGDFTAKEVFDELKKVGKKMVAVKGNCDRFELSEYAQFSENGKKMGVVHSHQFGRGNIDFLEEFALSQGLDILIFGHTHTPLIEKREKVLLINPGSANGIEPGRGNAVGKTYALLEIEEGKEPNARIEKID